MIVVILNINIHIKTFYSICYVITRWDYERPITFKPKHKLGLYLKIVKLKFCYFSFVIMKRYTVEKRIQIVDNFYKNYVIIANGWTLCIENNNFGRNRTSSVNTCIKTFHRTGSFCNIATYIYIYINVRLVHWPRLLLYVKGYSII